MWTTDEAPTLFDCVHLYGEDYDRVMSDYPIWDEDRREWLNQKIFEHFAYREIAQETSVDHMRLLRRTMHEMMPAVNPVFVAIGDNPDIKQTYDGYSESADEGTSTARQLYSATPQTQLSGAENYATNLTDTQGNTSNLGSGHTYGSSGDLGSLVTQWMRSINNALYIVYNGLEPLYQQVFELDSREVRPWQ